MKVIVLCLVGVLMGVLPCQAKDKKNDFRFSIERVLTGVAMGTRGLIAGQFEMDVYSFDVPDITVGFSIRKEGGRLTDGWGLGIHSWRGWLKEKPVTLITEAGIRWFAPPVAYSKFASQLDGVTTTWQWWEHAVHTTNPPVFPDGGNKRYGSTVSPVLGLFAQRRVRWFTVRGGIRAAFVRYGLGESSIGPDGLLHVVQDERYWRIIFAPVITVGF